MTIIRAGRLVLLACATASVACGGASGDDAASERFDADLVAEGRRVFLNNGCANCHGEDGSGSGAIASSFAVRPRDYRDPAAYRFGTDVASIAETVAQGIPNPGSSMPAFGHLSEASRTALAHYIVSLQHPDADDIEVLDAWVSEAIPGTDVLGAYLTLRNDGSDDVVIAVEAAGAGEAMLHSTSMEDGMMRMSALDELVLPAGATVTLEPGGDHLMLEKLNTPPASGDTVLLTLFLDSHRAVRVQAPVRSRDGAR